MCVIQMISAADGKSPANVFPALGWGHTRLRLRVPPAPQQAIRERHLQPSSQYFAEDGRRVRAMCKSSSPVERHRHNKICLSCSEPLDALLPDELPDGERQSITLDSLHLQEQLAQPARINARRNCLIEPQLASTTAGTTARLRRMNRRHVAVATKPWNWSSTLPTRRAVDKLDLVKAGAAKRQARIRPPVGKLCLAARARGWEHKVKSCAPHFAGGCQPAGRAAERYGRRPLCGLAQTASQLTSLQTNRRSLTGGHMLIPNGDGR
jgi:hypothetical protein